MAEVSAADTKPKMDGGAAAVAVSPIDSLFRRRIEFHPERKPYSPVSSTGGDFRVETLNPDTSSRRPLASQGVSTAETAPLAAGKISGGGELLEHGFDPEDLGLKITFRRIGAGLANLGNTCFLNSVLQCLTYTEPFVAYLRSGKHKSSCHTSGFCAMCALQSHVMVALESTGKILSPAHLVKNLRCISRNFHNYRQEDAHEYMVNLLESMHKCCLPTGVPSESPSAYERSLVHKIFGGRLRSQVTCVQCSNKSNKFDPFLDLSLEIVNADSLYKALTHFTAIETLDGGESQYQCQRCKKKVRALKQLTIHKAPNVLTIHLKRFRLPGQKIDKKVGFEPTLKLNPFVSDKHEGDLKYTLYGVLVHAGWSTRSGHYYCFVRTSSGMWHSLNDNQVIQVSEKTVLAQKAYMLFYVRDRSSVIKRSAHLVHKDNNLASTLGNKVIPQSSSILNGTIPNGVAESKISAPGHEKSKADSISCGQSINSPMHPIQKEPSTEKNDNIILKEVPVLECNGHDSQNRVSIFQSDANVLSKKLEQINHGMRHLPIGYNGKVNVGISTYVENLNKLPTEKGTHENGDAANNIVPDNLPTLKIDSDPVFTKKELINSSGQSNPLKETLDTSVVGYQKNGLEDDKCSSLLKLKKTKLSSISKEQNTGDVVKEKPKFSVARGLHFGRTKLFLASLSLRKSKNHKRIKKRHGSVRNIIKDSVKLKKTKLSSISKEQNTGDVVKEKPKPKLKFSVARGLHFGRTQLFLASLGLRKSKKHKRIKKWHGSVRNIIKDSVPDLDTNDLGRSTPEAVGVVGEESEHLSRKASSNSIIQQLNNSSCYNGDSMKINDRDKPTLASSERLKTSSSPSFIESSARETDANDRVQSHLMGLLLRGMNETTVSRWDSSELQPSQTHVSDDAQNGKIGYVLDEWDEEYDQGKRKKLRKRDNSFGGPNQFQETANIKAQQRKKLKTKVDRKSRYDGASE